MNTPKIQWWTTRGGNRAWAVKVHGGSYVGEIEGRYGGTRWVADGRWFPKQDCELDLITELPDCTGWDWQPEPLPLGIYYNQESDNFYYQESRKGCGQEFYKKWLASEFPPEPKWRAATAADIGKPCRCWDGDATHKYDEEKLIAIIDYRYRYVIGDEDAAACWEFCEVQDK